MDPDGTVEFMEVRDRTPQQKKWLNWELKFRKGFKPNKQQFNAWLKAVEQRRHELQSSEEPPLVDIAELFYGMTDCPCCNKAVAQV